MTTHQAQKEYTKDIEQERHMRSPPMAPKVEIIKGDSYRLLSSKEQVQIQGQSDITIDGRHKLFINKSQTTDNHYDIQIGAGASINIQVDDGDVNIHTLQGKINMNAGGDYNLKVGGNCISSCRQYIRNN